MRPLDYPTFKNVPMVHTYPHTTTLEQHSPRAKGTGQQPAEKRHESKTSAPPPRWTQLPPLHLTPMPAHPAHTTGSGRYPAGHTPWRSPSRAHRLSNTALQGARTWQQGAHNPSPPSAAGHAPPPSEAPDATSGSTSPAPSPCSACSSPSGTGYS